nr:uncharacterized protein LOC114919982 isoform X2 [Labrus bergylta]
MEENTALCTRLFVLLCAAVMLFFMYPDAARASPITIQVDNEVKHKVLRRLHTPNSQHHQLYTGQLSPEFGLQSGPPSNTEAIWHYRKAPSIIDHQPKPLGFTEGSFGYNQNSPDNRQSYAGMTRVQSGMLPANSMSTSNNPYVGENVQGLKSSVNYHPTNGNLHNSYSAIIRRASYKDPASPYFQSSSRSVVRNPSIAQKSYQEENEAEDKSVWQPPKVSPFSSQTSRYSSTSLPTQRMPYSGYKETDELPGSWAQSTSRAIQSRKYPSVAGQTAPHAPLISDSLDAYVIKSSRSTEPQRSSIADFSQGWPSTRNSEVLREKNGQSYLFKNSQGDRSISYLTISHTQRPSDTPLYGMFSSNLQQRGPTKYIKQPSESVNPMDQSASIAQYGAQTDSFKQSHHTTAGTLVQTLVLPSPGTDDTRKTFPHCSSRLPGQLCHC